MYDYFFPPKSVVSTKNYLGPESKITSIPINALDKPYSTTYTFELWLFVSSVPNKPSNIFSLDTSSSTNIISLDLGTSPGLATNLNLIFQSKGVSPPFVLVETDNFPLNRWVYIVITLKNTLVELYIDGKLIHSVNIVNQQKIPTITWDTNINFGNKLDAYIAGLNRSTTILSSKTIWENYKNGKQDLEHHSYVESYNPLYRLLRIISFGSHSHHRYL